MALDMKKVGRKKNKADEMLEQMEIIQTNSATSTIDSLNTASGHSVDVDNSPAQEEKTSIDKRENSIPNSERGSINQLPLLDRKGNPDRGYGLNLDGTFKQSRAGRKKKEDKDKRTQIALTIDPKVSAKLEIWAKDRRRSVANYLSMYVEENLDGILEYFDKK